MSGKFYSSMNWRNKRTYIMKRDGYRCRECARYGKNVDAVICHHCYPLHEYPELRLTNWNLIALCFKCHELMHDRNTDTLTELGEYWKRKVSPPTYNQIPTD